MSRLLAVVITYFPEENQLLRNIGSFIDDVDGIIIWENTPADQAVHYRFIQNPKIVYMGMGNNVGIAKALNLCLSYAVDKQYDYMMTMDQDSDWENFSWFKSVIVDNSAAPEALYGPVRTIQSIEAQRFESNTESAALTVSLPQKTGSYPQFVDNSTETQKVKPMQVSNEKEKEIKNSENDHLPEQNTENSPSDSKSTTYARLIPTMNLITSGMLAKTSLLQRLGGYWKDLFVDGIDEELVCRAKTQGINSYFVEGAQFNHQLGYPIRKRFFGKSYTVPGYSKARLYDRYKSMYMLKDRFSAEKYPPAQYPELAQALARLDYDWKKTAPIRILLGADHRFSKLMAIWKGKRDGKRYARAHASKAINV